jgi:ribose transport system permease protein
MDKATLVSERHVDNASAENRAAYFDWIRRASVAIGCIALFVVFSSLIGTFYRPANLLDIMLQSSINAVIAVGMTLVVMTKGIDLSVGSIVGVSSMIAASVLPQSLWLGVGAGLTTGLICGLLNGVLIAKLKLPDFIVTLGTMSIFRGAALIYTDGKPIYGIDKVFRATFAGTAFGIPAPVLFALAIAVLAYLLIRFTTFGEQIIAVGVLSSIAGFILVARIGAAEPIGGNGFELQAIGAAVIGGASLFGGEGNPFGSLVGALTLGAMRNGLTLLNVPSFWQFVATGVVVILAVLADQVTRRRR